MGRKPTPPANKPDQVVRYNDDGTPDLPGLLDQGSQDTRPFRELTNEFSRRRVIRDIQSANRGMDDAWRRTGYPSRVRDFLRSRYTNPNQ